MAAVSRSTQMKVNISAELGTGKVKSEAEILYKRKPKLNSHEFKFGGGLF